MAAKKGIGIGILLIAAFVIWAMTRPKEAPPENENEEPGGVITPAVTIELPGVVGSPAEFGGTIEPGVGINLEASIRNSSTRNGAFVSLPVTVKFYIYEGSFWGGHGTLLRTLSVPATLPANTIASITSPAYATVVGTIDRRDVGVEVIYDNRAIGSDEWDDVYYVKQAVVAPAIQVLSIGWM